MDDDDYSADELTLLGHLIRDCVLVSLTIMFGVTVIARGLALLMPQPYHELTSFGIFVVAFVIALTLLVRRDPRHTH